MKPDEWPTVRLDEVCDIRIGRTPRRDKPECWGGNAVWVTVGELNGGVITDSKEHVSDLAVAECMPEPIPPGTLLFSFKLSIGKVGIAGCPLHTNEAIAALPIRNPDKLSRDFLRYALLSTSHEGGANKAVLGKVLNKEKVSAIRISLPPLPEQERLVRLLDEADALRRLRARADERMADFVPALFHEMFGDPARNDKGWPTGVLGDVISEAKDGPHVSPKYANGGIPFLSTRNIRAGKVIWEDLRYISREEAERHWLKCKPEYGDVLYTKGGTTGIAKAIDFQQDIAVWVHIAVLKTNHDLVVPVWLENMLNSDYCYSQSQQLTHGIANHDLGLTRMINIRLFIPPLSLQHEFTARVASFDKLRTLQAQSKARLEALFESMLARAFAGEL